MDEDQQLRREIQAHWRELIISRIGRLNGQRVGELGVADLEWAERRWMEQIRRSWFEVDQDVHVHYYALECAIRGLHPELASPKPAASQEQRFPVLMPLEHGTSQAWPQPPPAPIAKPTDVREREHDSSAREDPRRQETIAKEEAVEQIIEEAERPEQLPSLADKDQELSSSEQSRLTVLERTVEEGLATFVEIGIALAEIRDRRLYRAAYRTFESYCRQRWALAASRARQLMLAAEVVKNLKDADTTSAKSVTIVTTVTNPTLDKSVAGISPVILPTSERQTRPLSGLGSEQQRQVWEKSVEASQGRPSEQVVREVREAMFPQVKAKPQKMKRKADSLVHTSGDISQGSDEVESKPYGILLSFLKDLERHPENYDHEIVVSDPELTAAYEQVRARFLGLIEKLEPNA